MFRLNKTVCPDLIEILICSTDEILKAVSGKGSNRSGRKVSGTSSEEYKSLLKEQEDTLFSLRQRVEELQAQNFTSDRTVADLRGQLQVLKDQNALLKAQKGNGINSCYVLSVVVESSQQLKCV